MIYMTGVINNHVNTLKAGLGLDLMLGMIVQPATARYAQHACYHDWIGLDNGCFSEAGRARFTLPTYLSLIDELQEKSGDNLLWATAPDVVGDWSATLEKSLPVLETIREHAPVALVTQDGASVETVPWDGIDCVFVGGSTAWKFGDDSRRIMIDAKRRNKWVHCGRVNSLRRMMLAERFGADSCDGTYLAYTDPIVGLADVVNWLYEVNGPDPWSMDGENRKDWACRLYGDDPTHPSYRWFPKLLQQWRDEEMAKTSINVPAIRYSQGKNVLYSFVMDAKQLETIAKVSWIHEEENGNIVGFQRPEIASHIKNIRSYLEGDADPMIPNSLILGLTKKPKFAVVDGDLGMLTITGQNALVVDGQQRAAALRDCALAEFKMNVVAFVAEDDAKLNEHFVRVNSSKPLTSAFLRTLTRTFEGSINPKLDKERRAIILTDRLNRDEDSPFKGRIKTTVHPDGFISETSVLKMLQESLRKGYLAELQDDEVMLGVVKRYWDAVSDVFVDAWDLPPTDSRLTHAAGIRSLSHIMDQVCDFEENPEKLTKTVFTKALKKLKCVCHWTEGSWAFSEAEIVPWDKVQNTETGIESLKRYLNREYRKTLKKGDEDAVETAA